MLKAIKRLNVLRFQIERTEAVLAVLNEAYSPELVEYLRKYDINLPFDITNHESFQRDLLVAANMVKRWYHDLKILEDEIGSDSKKRKLDRRYFEDLLFHLSKFAGYLIRAKDVTVAEYAAVFRAYDDHVRALNAKSMSYGKKRAG
jgi:hypothetical protein